ncbi:LysE family translocator [Oceanospirillum beijerinckii]|uniref:LysE family translocator n=1 Tax=Oceanospirillum beijerinckii TaxID=64976 RepID=UPI000427D1BA|nr:LysE family translocator [Oceanospirillum beijerinckii]
MSDILMQLASYFDASFFTFLVAITLLTMSPGVDTVVVIRNTLRGGRIDGLTTSFAICCGLFVHALVSAVGISFILLQSASLFALLKLVGAAYLIWLGFKSLRSAWGKGLSAMAVNTDAKNSLAGKGVSLTQSFREGFLSNVLNPKTIVFYMAFLPQFIQPHESVMLKSMFLAGVHFVIGNLWQLLLILMVAKARQWLSSEKAMRWMDGVIGSIMMAFGIRLAAES